MAKPRYDQAQLKDLLLQMMETELGGEQVYRTALTCAVNEDLKKEWEGYLEETLSHQNVVRTTCEFLGINADEVSPSRGVVKHIGSSLVKAMELAIRGGEPCCCATRGLRVCCARGNQRPCQLGTAG